MRRSACGGARVLGADAQWVGLGVEDILVEGVVGAVAKEEVEVLERLRREERLHPPVQLPRSRAAHVRQRGVSAARHARLALDGLKDSPAPFAVLRVAGEAPEDEERLDGLRAQQAVRRPRRRRHARRVRELGDLGRQPRGRVGVHSVASPHQLARELHVGVGGGAGGAEGEHAGGEAGQVVHPVAVLPRPVVPGREVCAVAAPRPAAAPHEMGADRADGVVVHPAHARIGLAGEEPLLEEVLVQAVRPRPQRHFARRELPRLRRDEHGIEPPREVRRPHRHGQAAAPAGGAAAAPAGRAGGRVGRRGTRVRHRAQMVHHPLRHGLVRGLARVPRERAELQLERRDLGDGARAARPLGVVACTAPEAKRAVRQPVRRVEREQQPAPQLLRLAQQRVMARRLICREEAAEHADRHLEEVDLLLVAEVEVGVDPLERLLHLRLQPRHDQAVQTVHQRQPHPE